MMVMIQLKRLTKSCQTGLTEQGKGIMSNQGLQEFLSLAEHHGVTHLKGAVTLALTDEEKTAALRFCETCEDGEGHDIPKPMMKRLAALGLVVHKGFGVYEGTPALNELQGSN
jgi:hypothetical protein